MNILIIGNGFDRANKLPTRYSDFLQICKLIRETKVKYNELDLTFYSITEEEKTLLTSFYVIGEKHFIEFSSIAKNNLFIEHFLIREKVLGDKWLNFEEEIEFFINTVIDGMHNSSDETVTTSKITALNNYLNNYSLMGKITYKDLFLRIKQEHENLTKLLEIYMDGYINKLSPTPIAGFKKGFYDYCLSFNYTSTYENYYEKTNSCYIHGKANLNRNNRCDMVLGFDNRFKYSDLSELEMLPYEKFFQRLELGTSNDYMTWLKNMDRDGQNTVDIYGHSLARADADILEKFITRTNTTTRIYYCDQLDYFDKLKNLTMILGADRTIEMVGGLKPVIHFLPINEYTAA